MKGLAEKKVLITGGTSGIGQAIAVRFAAEGAHGAINYRKSEEYAAETDARVHQALVQCVHEVETHGVNHILGQARQSRASTASGWTTRTRWLKCCDTSLWAAPARRRRWRR